jgi:uncharacterized membrane protein
MSSNKLIHFNFHRIFSISVFIKGLDGLLEIVAGFLLLFVSHAYITRAVVALTAPELSEDPDDIIANFLRHSIYHFSENAQHYASLYLIVNGVLKVFLMASLLREKLWAFRPVIFILSIFVLYQLYRFYHVPSIGLLIFALFDVLIIFIVLVEYRQRKSAGSILQ